MKHTLLILTALLLVGCNAEKRFNDYSIKNPDKFKTLAAILAPCIDEITKSDTLYQTKTDTLIQAAISDTVRFNDTVYITKTLAGKTITKTQVQTITNTVADTRALEACEIKTRTADDKALQAETKLEASEKSGKKKTWWIVGLAAALVGSHVLRSYFGNIIGWVKGVVGI